MRANKITNYVISFMEGRGYPNACIEESSLYFSSLETKGAFPAFSSIVDLYEQKEERIEFSEFNDAVNAFCNKYDLPHYLTNLLLFVCMSRKLKEIYVLKGLPLDIYEESLKDIFYKLNECILVKKQWGNFVPSWELGFFQLRLFGFGVLQFEVVPCPSYACFRGLTEKDKIINVHLPRTGRHLDKEEVLREMEQAGKFFAGQYSKPAFLCVSYLMHPINRELLKPQSHLAQFMNLFEIVHSWDDPAYLELWRLFDMEIDPEHLETLPTDTSYRRGYIEVMRQKRKIGHGVGIRFFKE